MNDTPGNPSENKARVLLVDDNLTNLQVLFQALEEEGYELLVAQSGKRLSKLQKPPARIWFCWISICRASTAMKPASV